MQPAPSPAQPAGGTLQDKGIKDEPQPAEVQQLQKMKEKMPGAVLPDGPTQPHAGLASIKMPLTGVKQDNGCAANRGPDFLIPHWLLMREPADDEPQPAEELYPHFGLAWMKEKMNENAGLASNKMPLRVQQGARNGPDALTPHWMLPREPAEDEPQPADDEPQPAPRGPSPIQRRRARRRQRGRGSPVQRRSPKKQRKTVPWIWRQDSTT